MLPVFAFSQVEQSETLILMGSRFSFTAVAEHDSIAHASIEAGIEEVQRIERLISSWNDSSETSSINRNTVKGSVTISHELFELIYRSKKVSSLTEGAFDISFSGLDNVWRFDGSMTQVPDSQAIAASIKHINWNNIKLDRSLFTVEILEGMKIGFGGIGKGYAANKAKAAMLATGASGGVVNAGGDLTAWGRPAQDSAWGIAIANPVEPDQPIGWLNINDLSVVTSGSYERFAMIDGVRYAHIIDPRTGWPAKGLVSVTITCPDAELADALATAVFVLGKENGLALVNRLVGIECLIVDENGNWFATDGLSIK
ncbi:MAG: FAD:protein FMN transferase [Bacteroidia bacterium]